MRRRDLVMVSTVDLLARAALDAAAEVVVAADRRGGSIAVPARDLVGGGSWCVLGPAGRVGLVVPGWTDVHSPQPVTELRAMTFAAFLGVPPERADR